MPPKIESIPLSNGQLLRVPPVTEMNTEEVGLRRRNIVAAVECWSCSQVANYLSGFPIREFDPLGRPPGFSIASRRIISRAFHSDRYPDPSTLPESQRQPHGNRPSADFDKVIVALVGPCLVGMTYCEWTHVQHSGPFWGYRLSFVDVHEAWRKNGITSKMIGHLGNQPWLTRKHLYLTTHPMAGQSIMTPVIQRSLTHKPYHLHPQNGPEPGIERGKGQPLVQPPRTECVG